MYYLYYVAVLTLSIPDNLKKEMETMDEVNWSAVARHAIKERIEQLRILDEMAKNSKLTMEDAIQIGRKIKANMHRRYMKEHPEYYQDETRH